MSEPVTPQTVPTQSNRSRLRRVVEFVRRWTCYLIWVLVATGLMLRATVYDRYHPWALFVYVTPIPAIAIWTMLAWLIWPQRTTWKARRFGRSLGFWNWLFVVGFLGWTGWSQFVFQAQPTDPSRMRVVFWNVARAPAGIDAVAAHLKTLDASVIALVEANPNYKREVEHWQAALPGYTVVGTHFGGIVAVRGDLVGQLEHHITKRGTSWCDQFNLNVGNQQFSLLLVDVSSQLSLSRREPLSSLADLVQKLSDRPVIVVGDFNTPDDSVWFEPLRKSCHLAFREHGAGYAATWPVPLPVLTLDQMWVNSDVDVKRCELGWSLLSDHRPIIAEVVTSPSSKR